MRYFVRAGIVMAGAAMLSAQFHLPGTGGKSDSTPKTKAPVSAAAPITPVASTGFEYYVLALSWAPGKRGPFLVRGLWPEKSEGAGPEACAADKSEKKVSKGAMSLVLPLMESREAIQTEWEKHGSCSGLSAADFFNGLKYTRSQVQIPVQFTSLEDAATQSPLQIEAQFAGANPGFPAGAFRVGCDGGKFTEVRVCFDPQFKARGCMATAGECGAAELSIRPR
jgi:ribonuclease T2